MKTTRIILLAVACTFGAFACEENRDGAYEPEEQPEEVQRAAEENPRAAGVTHEAVESIVQARCEREVRCGNVGADRTYTNEEQCQTATRNEWRDELNAYECEEGVERDELAECVNEVRNEDCGNPLDSLGRALACRASDICDAV